MERGERARRAGRGRPVRAVKARAACRLCGGRAAFALTAREMMLGTRERFDYLECAACGSLQIDPLPVSLDRFYPPDYYTRVGLGDDDPQETRGAAPASPRRAGPAPSPARDASRMGRRARRRISELRLSSQGALGRALSGRRYARFDWFRRTGTGLDDAILDVGCGSGRLLRRLSREGFTKLVGIDPQGPARPSEDSRIRLLRESPEEHVGEYRLVMAHHSFEHMRDPVAAFAAMARLVERGGHLLLRVPVADGWARSHYGADWVQLDAPRHLHLPTRRAVAILAAGSGLRLLRSVDDSGPFQIWGSELYRRDIPLSGPGESGRSALPWSLRLRARFEAARLRRTELGDQACFYLRRD